VAVTIPPGGLAASPFPLIASQSRQRGWLAYEDNERAKHPAAVLTEAWQLLLFPSLRGSEASPKQSKNNVCCKSPIIIGKR
jgi:hypothetical protein